MGSSRQVKVNNLIMGGGAPISIQSMTNTDSRDQAATLAQTRALAEAGCQIIRLSVNHLEAPATIAYIKAHMDIPLVADIHFNHKLALASIEEIGRAHV